MFGLYLPLPFALGLPESLWIPWLALATAIGTVTGVLLSYGLRERREPATG